MGKIKDKLKKEIDRDIRRVKVEVYHDVKYVKTHIPKVIASFIIFAFFIILFVLFKTKQGDKFSHPVNEMVALAKTKNHIVKPTSLSTILKSKDKKVKLIDLRSSKDRKIFTIDGSMHIPFERILESEYKELWNDDNKKILFCRNEIESNQAWLILTELGYKNISVLEGGANYWREFTKSEFGFKSDQSKDDEKPKFDYKKTMDVLKGVKPEKKEVKSEKSKTEKKK